MEISVNGNSLSLNEGMSVADLVIEQDLTGQRFAIEINEELVPRTTFDQHIIQHGDVIEVVRAIGGG